MDVITSCSSSEGRGAFGVDSESSESTNSAKSGDNDAPGRNYFCLPPPFQSDSLQSYSFGDPGSLRHRIVFCDADNQEVISPYNDIPLYGPGRLLRCICTTPAGSSIRRQMAEDEPYHPLRVCQRAADASLSGHFRDDAPWNVCILPQTQTFHSAANTDYSGGASTLAPDLRRCPAEFIDLGADKARKVGEVYLVTPLAAFVVVDVRDRRQICWKIVGVAADDPMADKLLGVVDAHDELPGILELVREWIRSDLCVEEGAIRTSPKPTLVHSDDDCVCCFNFVFFHLLFIIIIIMIRLLSYFDFVPVFATCHLLEREFRRLNRVS